LAGLSFHFIAQLILNKKIQIFFVNSVANLAMTLKSK
jgi:hypothetical protein